MKGFAFSARRRALLAGPVAAAWLAACGPAATPPAPSAPPPVEVGVVTVTATTVGLLTELPGRTEASRVAQVRARVAGILQRQLFREGSEVKADQPLFQIDAAPYSAALASAQAALARAQANLMQAQAQAERYKPLVEANAISQQDFIVAVAAQKQAEADVAAGKAAVQTAQINRGYAAVNSPIAGRIGRALVTEGALVGQGEVTPLALVQQIDPMYVNVTQPVADVLRLRAAIASGQLKSAGGKEAAAVRIVLDDGSVYPLPARLLFSDLSVDPSSGQISLRAEVPNPKGVLLPGMYVRARLEQAAASAAMLLPQQAVERSSQGDSVKVVAADGSVGSRAVKVSAAKDGQWVVLEGLKAGEQVVVDGFQKLQGKARAKPVPWTAAGPASAPASAAASAARS
ncbi:MAG: efflux RND transporter periplasmic adaptor subunit [Rhodoferax sp.]|uniref:efflux RND transporter periplasmic adaptor subunit n=1 Tax=Rhodoferax sp. TaxID=50421 RepID=UPI002620A0C8|nr:efflux RND transporter periplasmic adaptor subunit [Rhodoferax sp.]MDD5332783.1 efflux RND transporter periplasmic adaptor subunit [Rhodoferax sp.]